MITEFVTFTVLDTTTDEQLLAAADILINNFWKKQDGFIDAELVKGIEKNAWCFIYRNDSLVKLNAAGAKMRNSREFGQFISLIVPQSIGVTFNQQLKKW